MTSSSLMYEAGHPRLMLWDNSEGWGGEGGGRGFGIGGHMCTSFECPASCIELVLVIYFTYGNIHISMLFSHIYPTLTFYHIV